MSSSSDDEEHEEDERKLVSSSDEDSLGLIDDGQTESSHETTPHFNGRNLKRIRENLQIGGEFFCFDHGTLM